ncbi:hypothetical protein BJX70DRAFT_339656 [Aspergillus crustosus]
MFAFCHNRFFIATAISLLLTPSPALGAQIPRPSQLRALNNRTNTIFAISDEFSFTCLPLTPQLSDPIVSLGEQSIHAHVITGGTAFQRMMGEQTARGAKGTTCEVSIDRCNYSAPALYHQTANGNRNRIRNGSFAMVPYE